MKRARILPLLLSVLLLAGLLCACGSQTSAEAPTSSGPGSSPPAAAAAPASPDLNAAVQSGSAASEEGAVSLTLSDAEGSLTIRQAGTYLLSGSLTDGQILIDAPEDAKVKLILNGVSVTCRSHATVYARSADKLILSTASGSVNLLASVGDFVQIDDKNVDAAVFACCDLTLNGEGTLNLSCETGHGLVSKDDLKLKDGTVNVAAAKKGLEGKDSLTVEGCTLSVEAGTKGLVSGKDEETGSILLSGGSLSVFSRDDAIHCSGSVKVEGGTLVLSSGDDGIHADETLIVSGGRLSVTQSYEGLEAQVIEISGGELYILASDDGINAAGGNDGSNGFGPFGGDPFRGDSSASLSVSGGVLVVNAEGDGLDSNGLLSVSGGEVYISGPTRGGNGALDYGTESIITGGTVIAVGSADMAENFGPSSTQGSILLSVGSQAAGTTVSITDETGTILASYTPEKSYQSVVVSAPGLEAGKSYTVTAGSFSQTVSLDSLIYGGGMGMGGHGMGGFPGGGMGGGPGSQGGFPGGQGGPGRRP